MFIFGAAISFEAQSSMDIRQLAKVQRAHWRKFSRHSSIGESAGGVLAKVQWTLANGETPDCEIPTGEVPATPLIRAAAFTATAGETLGKQSILRLMT